MKRNRHKPSDSDLDKLTRLFKQNLFNEAEQVAEALTARFPAHGFAWKVMGVIYLESNRLEEGLKAAKRAVQLLPDDAAVFNNLGNIYFRQEKFNEAEINFRRALAIAPDYAKALFNLASLLRFNHKLEESEECSRRALATDPSYTNAHIALGYTLELQARLPEAHASYKAALTLSPDMAALHTDMLHLMSLDVEVTQEQLFAEHVAFGNHFEEPYRGQLQSYVNTKDPDRQLQIGFVTGDLNNHALANYLEPLFEFLTKKPSLALHIYYTKTIEDEVTRRFKAHLPTWNLVGHLNEDELASKIRADGIDILLDLAGHTVFNRLMAFARKPAPIQASWLGYLGTTGLKAMDYSVADAFWIPPGQLDWQFTEKIAYLPSAMIFQPNSHAAPINALPALTAGKVTFGSFNRHNKINDAVIALWSMLLHKVPDSDMVLVAVPDEFQERLIQGFERAGIDRSRLTFFGRTSQIDYLTLHHHADICLDTYPHGGGATTAHAAWMGVPTLCLMGNTPASRFGATEMHHLGLGGFIAESIEDFVEKGCYWAANIAELAALRQSMRTRFNESPLGQHRSFADNFEAMLRAMWVRWCNDQPVEMLQIEAVNNSSDQIASEFEPSMRELDLLQALHHQRQFKDAEALARRLVAQYPEHGLAWKILGSVLRELGQREESLALQIQITEMRPDDHEAHFNLACEYHQQGKLDESVKSYIRSLGIQPNNALAYLNLSAILKTMGLAPESEMYCRQAIALKPDMATAHNNLGNALQGQGRFVEAQASYEHSLTLQPEQPETLNNLAITLKDQGYWHEANDTFRRALKIKPDWAAAHSNLLYCMSHDVHIEPKELHAEHLAFGEAFEKPLRGKWLTHTNTREPARILQIGFVSADFYDHALTNFLEPVFAALSNEPNLVMHAYYTHIIEDAANARMKKHFAKWHGVSHLSPDDLATQIRADGIDILFDLTGHTAHNRLLTFARKPAPIQVSWLGYLGTTGLEAMDFYLCDEFWVPPGELDWQFTEKMAYLPSAVAFQPSEHAPAINALPALRNGYITFGSFNRPNKLNESVIILWSMLLREVPNAQMILGGIPLDSEETLRLIFAHEGIAQDRLTFFSRSNLVNYLTLHHQVDLCLDTFPYGGGATTANAAWMGVPTLSLAGETPPSRFGSAMTHQLGLDGFIATSIDDFVGKGCYWGENLSELANIRQGLRERFSASLLGQTTQLAKHLESKLREIWQTWCDERPPEIGITPNSLEIACSAQIENNGPKSQDLQALIDLYNDQLFPEAAELAQNLADRFPEHGLAWKILGSIHQTQQCYAESLPATQRAIELLPDDASNYNNLGVAFLALERLGEAEVSFNKAIALDTKYGKAFVNLGATLQIQGRLTEAQACCEKAIAMDPSDASAHIGLGKALEAQGQLSEAQASYYRADMAHEPRKSVAHSNVLYLLNHDVLVDPQHLFAEHVAFGEQFEAPLREHWMPHTNSKDPARCLKVGFVSGDFNHHALANFLEPAFKYLGKKKALEIHAFYTHSEQDVQTLNFRSHFAYWHNIYQLTDQEFAAKVREQGIDILVDLAGHTAKNRLLTFARRPAPLQVSWLGYLGTTGLQAIDYILCDQLWMPPGELDWQFTEKLAYLPTATTFQLGTTAPPINTLPALHNKHITFGSFNRPNKINDSVIVLWSMLMHKVPTSKMVLGAMSRESQEKLMDKFEMEGIDPSRLSFFPRSQTYEYLSLHHQVDLCLDTFPHGGGATTAHAAWMGVPTLCLVGATAASRYSASLMQHLGLTGFAAHSIEDFIEKGSAWSENLAELATLRRDIRTRFETSPLGQPARFADNLDAMFRKMWQVWCQERASYTMFVEATPMDMSTEASSSHQEKAQTISEAEMAYSDHTPPSISNEFQQRNDNSIVISAIFLMAKENEESGRLLEASHLYLEILKLSPRHHESNHNLGLIEAQLSEPALALPRFEIAVQENPDCEAYWVSYINTLMQSGAVETAISAIEWGQKYGLTSTTAELMTNNFVSKLENIMNERNKRQTADLDEQEDTELPPAWPSPKSSLSANLDYIVKPRSSGRRYVIYSPLYRGNSSGIRVLFDLQKWLICSGFDAIIIAGTNGYALDQFADDIIIYPEVVTGNPLKAKRVVRYILNFPGKLGGTKTYAKHELLVAYSNTFAAHSNGAILMIPPVEPFFYSDATPKIRNAVYTGKEADLNLHPKDCEYITREFPSTRREVAQFMRSVKTLYSYDLISAIGHEAMLCGCKVKYIRKDGVIEDFPAPVTLLAADDEFKAQLHDFIEVSQML